MKTTTKQAPKSAAKATETKKQAKPAKAAAAPTRPAPKAAAPLKKAAKPVGKKPALKVAVKKPAQRKAPAKKAKPAVDWMEGVNAKASPKKNGRPTAFSEALGDLICDLMADGYSLRTICSKNQELRNRIVEGNPEALPLFDSIPNKGTIFRWVDAPGFEKFCDQYLRAQSAQAQFMAEDILEIADNGSNDTYVDAAGNVKVDQDVIARSRLRVEARKWLMSKMAPKKFGDRVSHEVGGVGGAPIQTESSVTIDPSDAYLRMLNGSAGG